MSAAKMADNCEAATLLAMALRRLRSTAKDLSKETGKGFIPFSPKIVHNKHPPFALKGAKCWVCIGEGQKHLMPPPAVSLDEDLRPVRNLPALLQTEK